VSIGGRRGATRLISHGAAFALGAVTAVAIAADAGPAPRDRLGALDAFAQALSYVATDYVEPRDERELLYGAIRGMVARLDRHSTFFGPAAYRRLREDTEGEFGGVGFDLGAAPRGTHPVVERLIPGSPADRAGIRAGDVVVAIDGEDTAGGTARQLSQRLRGPRGSRVELRLRDAAGRPVSRALLREQIKVPSVSHRQLARGVGYLRIRRFQEATSADSLAAVAALRRAPGGLRALILDLRDNPGGVFEQAIKVADLFLADGVIVSVRSRGVETERHVAHRAGTIEPVPMLVLVDQSTASAAELVAAALADHRRATLVGVPSFGKGSVQTFLDLPDGSGLKLTTALYFTPGGQSLDGNGITPDLVVEAFEDEVVVAGGGRQAPADPAPDLMDGLSAEVRDLVADDPQLAVALRTARRWLDRAAEKMQPRGAEGTSAP
jgi:carboxyl-terminal processing protease